jgi:hypothetical protein
MGCSAVEESLSITVWLFCAHFHHLFMSFSSGLCVDTPRRYDGFFSKKSLCSEAFPEVDKAE